MPPQLPLPKRKKRKRRRRRCLTTSLAPVPTTTWDSVSSTKESGYRVIKARLWGNRRRRRRKGKDKNLVETIQLKMIRIANMFHSCFITSQVSVKYVFVRDGIPSDADYNSTRVGVVVVVVVV